MKIDLGLAAFVLFMVALVGGMIMGFLGANKDVWEQTEDPACYLHINYDNRVFAADDATRVRYCEVQ